MPRIAYEDWNPSARSKAIVDYATAICREYAAAGYDLNRDEDLFAETRAREEELVAGLNTLALMDWTELMERIE